MYKTIYEAKDMKTLIDALRKLAVRRCGDDVDAGQVPHDRPEVPEAREIERSIDPMQLSGPF